MDTIMIIAQALAKAAKGDILRLDIQFNVMSDEYSGFCHIKSEGCNFNYRISENGEVENII